MDYREIGLIKKPYKGQEAATHTYCEITEWYSIERGSGKDSYCHLIFLISIQNTS